MFVLRASGAAISYAMFFVIARLIDPHEFGLFGFALSAAALASLLAGFGQSTAILRLWPQHVQAGAPGKAHAAQLVGLIALIALSLTILVVLWVLDSGLPQEFFGQYSGLFLPVGVLGLALAFSQFLAASLRARDRPWYGLIPREIVWRTAVIALIYLGVAFLDVAWRANTIIWLLSATLLALCLPQLWSVLSSIGSIKALRKVGFDFQSWRTLSVRLWQVTGLELLAQEFGVLVLGFLAAPVLVAEYFLAGRIASLLGFAVLAASIYVAPTLSKLHSRDDRAGLQEVCRTASLVSFCPALILCALVIGVGADILRFLDPAYESAFPILVVLSAEQLVIAGFGATGSLMQMAGQEREFLKYLRLSTAVSIIGAPVLFLVWGPMGVAFGIAAPRILRYLAASVHIRRTLHIDPTIFSFVWRGSRT